MKRAIITPVALPDEALDALKAWLGITMSTEDSLLTAQLRAALDLCEGFTGQMPLQCECEELLDASACWQGLSARPVQAITGVEGIAPDGTRFAMAEDAYAVELDADGGARVRVLRQGAAELVAVRFSAGLAADWSALPDGLRHGVVRLAAHHFRERDAAPGQSPPAAVAALWRPWRWMHLL